MRITRIDLENVKSYEQESVVFTSGTNAICGLNGAGKSTLLEAIGFVLFDFLAMTQPQFVREGAKTATVTVHVAGADGRPYQVVRKCGSLREFYVYDQEIDRKIADGKGDVVVWLHEFLGVEDSDDLSAIFRDAVGVPQGLLTAAFLDRASNRKGVFNPLLRVDEYETVWSELRAPRRYLEGLGGDQEKLIAGYEAELKALPAARETCLGLQIQIDVGEKRHKELDAELVDITQRKESLAAIKARLDALESSALKGEGKIAELVAELAGVQEAFDGALEAKSVVEDSASGHLSFLKAEQDLAELDKQRSVRDDLRSQRQSYVADLAVVTLRLEDLRARLNEILEADVQMDVLGPEVKKQELLELRLAVAERDADKLEYAKQNLAQEEAAFGELQSKLSRTLAQLAELSVLNKQIESLERKVKVLSDQGTGLTIRAGKVRYERAQASGQAELLEGDDGAECPLCGEPLTDEHRTELLAQNQSKMEELGKLANEIDSQAHKCTDEYNLNMEELRSLRSRSAALPREEEADDLVSQVEKREDILHTTRDIVGELSGAPGDVARLTIKLEALGDPRRDCERLAELLPRRAGVEKDLAVASDSDADLGAKIAGLDSELEPYGDLDKRIGIERIAMAKHAADHQCYLEHVRQAETVAGLQARELALRDELKDVRVAHDKILAERDEVAPAYDDAEYLQVVTVQMATQGELAALVERLGTQHRLLAEGRAEIERLGNVVVQRDKALEEHATLGELLSLLEYLRQVLRDAGPRITQALVGAVSVQASQLYAEIMGDESARLQWTEDYEILLASGDEERSFGQLSGGEQMIAALAVRLALLREVSSIDVAFFDEPTANLDGVRRDNLADQILKVKGFSQLFVISHDDTFERDTDHVVRVVKESGITKVEV